LNANDRTPSRLIREELIQPVYTGGVSAPDWRHVKDFPFKEFDSVILRKNARLGHPVVLVYRERTPEKLYRHGNRPLSLFDLCNPTSQP
jgi:hypothetical protein